VGADRSPAARTVVQRGGGGAVPRLGPAHAAVARGSRRLAGDEEDEEDHQTPEEGHGWIDGWMELQDLRYSPSDLLGRHKREDSCEYQRLELGFYTRRRLAGYGLLVECPCVATILSISFLLAHIIIKIHMCRKDKYI
jgi:hypothetical protein